MTPDNWPEPKRIIGKLGDLCTFKSLQANKGDEVYTATQVREIVRMEVEECARLADEFTHGMQAADAIRATLKENKDAD